VFGVNGNGNLDIDEKCGVDVVLVQASITVWYLQTLPIWVARFHSVAKYRTCTGSSDLTT